MSWFVHAIVHHPYIIIIAVAVFSGTCLVIPLTLRTLPNFSDPQLGFETRGTVLSKRIVAWENLNRAISATGPLSSNPTEYLYSKAMTTTEYFKPRKKPKKLKKYSDQTNYGKVEQFVNETVKNLTDRREENKWVWLKNAKISSFHNHSHLNVDGFFCGEPSQQYSHFVLETTDGKDLFSFKSIMTMCHIEHQLIRPSVFQLLCQTVIHGHCCHPWSLANYIAMIHNRTSCLAITEEDVSFVKILLANCSRFYHNKSLRADCKISRRRCPVPKECLDRNVVYNILHYLTDIDFLPPGSPQGDADLFLRQSMIYLPVACSTAALPFYHELNSEHLKYENVEVVAMDLGVRSTLFDEYLLRDLWLIGFGIVFVFMCMWLYTESLFLTIMTIIAILFSLGISYFMYTLVFELRFFPFINLLAAVITVGIGADDAFILCKIWHSYKVDKNIPMVKLISNTLYHAVVSMFITSLTTAVAFYSSSLNSITAIRCFGIFAGTTVIANFILMVTWLPACIVISEQWFCLPMCVSHFNYIENALRRLRAHIDKIWISQEKLLLHLVVRYKMIWLISLSTVAAYGIFAVVYYPKLQLPNTSDFQFFKKSHIFEQYELKYKYRFMFENIETELPENKLPLRFVWGINPIDNGNYLDPHSKGTTELDNDFDIAAPDSQVWLLQFCRHLRVQPFYQSTVGPLLTNCFIDFFKTWMERNCTDPMYGIDYTPCCDNTTFPYPRKIFNYCVLQLMSEFHETPSEYFLPGIAGPKFSKDQSPTIKAVVIEYNSNYTFNMSYKYMEHFYNMVESWMQSELKTAPDGMKNGWFISYLEFYDLQRVLSTDTIVTIGVSMFIAFVILILVTLNVPMSLFVILTNILSIFVTMALLVLLGWNLNVLESVAVCTTLGLTIDFSLHYAVNYRLCNLGEDRLTATKFALSSMAGPTAMAGLTTAVAGALMLPSPVLAYIEIGTFLIVVMGVSWFYSTFFLGSLLATIGPEKQFGQFRYSLWCCRRLQNGENSDTENGEPKPDAEPKVISGMSTSESHELDSLTGKSVMGASTSKGLQRSMSASKKQGNRFFPMDQSPSATSAITIIMAEDN